MVKYWHCDTGGYRVNPLVDAFFSDLLELYEKHNMSISHEDIHGCFILNKMCEDNVEYMRSLFVDLGDDT